MLGCSSLLPTDRCDVPVLAESNFNNASHVMHLTALTFLLSLSTICMKEVQTEEVPLDFTSLYSFCLSFFFTSLMKESMITDRPLVLTPPALCLLRLRSRATLFFFFFFTPYSRSYFSRPNFTSCKLQNTHKVPTDTDHWQVRCSPIDSGITPEVIDWDPTRTRLTI